jgi:hypothetical protein
MATVQWVQTQLDAIVGTTGASSYNFSFLHAWTSGHCLAGGLYIQVSSGVTLTGVTDDAGNTYSILQTVTVPSSTDTVVLFAKQAVLGSPTTLTLTFSGAIPNLYGAEFVWAEEFTPVGYIDGSVLVNTSSGTTPSSGNISTTAVDLLLGILVPVGSTVTAGSGFTLRTNDTTNGLYSETQADVAPGSVAATFNLSLSEVTQCGLIALAPPEMLVANPHFIGRYKTTSYPKTLIRQGDTSTLSNQGPLVANPHFITRYRPSIYAKPQLSWDTSPTLPNQGPLVANPHFIGRYKTTLYARPKLSEDAATTLPSQIEAQPHFINRYRTPIYVRRQFSEDAATTLPSQIEAQPHFIGRYQTSIYVRRRFSEDAATTLPPQEPIEVQPHFISRYRTPIYARPKLSEDAATTLPPQIEAQPHFISRYRTSIYARPKLSEDAATTLSPQTEAQPHFVSRYRTSIYARPKLSEDKPTTLHIQSAFSTANAASGQTSFSVAVNALGIGDIVTGAAILLLDAGTAAPAVTFTDNAGTPNTYPQLDNPTNGAGRFFISFALKIPPGGGGGTSITCTVGGGVTVNSTQIILDEWAGFDHVGNHAGANTSTADPITTGPITSVGPNTLYWGGFFNNSGTDACTPGSGFTGLIDANDAFWDPRTEYLIQVSPGSTAVTAANPNSLFTTIVGIVLETVTAAPPVIEAQPHFIGRYRIPPYIRRQFSEDAATTLPPQGLLEVQPHFITRYRFVRYSRPRTSEDTLPFVLPQPIEAQPHFVGRYKITLYARPKLSEDAATTLPLQREAQPHFIGRYRGLRYFRIQVSEDATGLSFTPPPLPTIVVAQRQYDYECSQLASQYNTGQLTVQQYYYALYALQWYFSGATDWNAFQAPMDADHVSPLTPTPSYGQSQFIGNFQGFRVVDGATLIATAQTLITLGCPRRAFPAPYPPKWAFQFYGRR